MLSVSLLSKGGCSSLDMFAPKCIYYTVNKYCFVSKCTVLNGKFFSSPNAPFFDSQSFPWTVNKFRMSQLLLYGGTSF
jgi:hypothetical protein